MIITVYERFDYDKSSVASFQVQFDLWLAELGEKYSGQIQDINEEPMVIGQRHYRVTIERY